ncbi:MAG: hypothetical protein ABJA67_14400 [Chthonomonadales bacterium]
MPASASVNVSKPLNGSTLLPTVSFSASATTTTCSKGVAAMGIYVDNSLLYVVSGSNLNTSLTLSTGNHRAVVQEWDSCGGSTSTPINLTVARALHTTLSALTSNNTSACPADGTLPAQCAMAFAGQSDTRSGVATVKYDRPAGNVSVEDPHGYLNNGSQTRIFANFMMGFCIKAGLVYCNSNVQTGYTSNNASTVGAQVEDLIRRHIDGAIMTWEGDGTNEDRATLLYQSYVNANHCGLQGCNPKYLIMYDGPSWAYTVASTGILNTSGAGCSGMTGATFEDCVVKHLRNDMCYLNGMHWSNSAYEKRGGQPILQVFPNEAIIDATGPTPSWADVWIQLQNWNNNLPGNCGKAPYNADNGVPLIIFQGSHGLTHAATSGSFYWVEPAGADPAIDQSNTNISPAYLGGTLDYFFQAALEHPSQIAWGAGFKGFNSFGASWGGGRIMDQSCGTTWITSLTEGNKYYTTAALPYLQIGTWNDYNEGTEIESGIDNCYVAGGSTSLQTLTWTLTPTDSEAASLSTVSHMEIYDSADGQNLTLLSLIPITISSPSGN